MSFGHQKKTFRRRHKNVHTGPPLDVFSTKTLNWCLLDMFLLSGEQQKSINREEEDFKKKHGQQPLSEPVGGLDKPSGSAAFSDGPSSSLRCWTVEISSTSSSSSSSTWVPWAEDRSSTWCIPRDERIMYTILLSGSYESYSLD